MLKFFKSEEGVMAIVEATIVFPIMFLVIFFLIFMGNAYLQKAKIQAVSTEMAYKGASYCADPMLQKIVNNGTAPGFKLNSPYNKTDDYTLPYRYFSDMDSVEDAIETETKNKLGNVSTGLLCRTALRFPT